MLLVTQRIHRLPKAMVLICLKFLARHQLFERFAFPDRFGIRDELYHRRMEYEESAVNEPAVARRLLCELGNLIVDDFQRAEPAGRGNCGNRGFLAMCVMEGDQLANIDIGNAVPIGHAERLVWIEKRFDCLEPATGLGIRAGIDQRDPPRLAALVMDLHAVVSEVERHVRRMEEVIREEFLDQITLVAKADHEIVHAMRGVDLHDVPNDRHPANLDHGLGPNSGFFAEPRTKATGQNYRYQLNSPEQLQSNPAWTALPLWTSSAADDFLDSGSDYELSFAPATIYHRKFGAIPCTWADQLARIGGG